MLIWDEFFYVPFVHLVRTGGDWSKWIFLQHNEHRMVPMKLVLAPLSVWTSWNVVAETYVSVVLVALTMWGVWNILRQGTDRGPLAFVPIAFLGRTVPKTVTAVFCLLPGAGLAIATAYGIDQARIWRSKHESLRAILLTYGRQPNAVLGSIHFPSDLSHYAPYLKHERLVAFHDDGAEVQ